MAIGIAFARLCLRVAPAFNGGSARLQRRTVFPYEQKICTMPGDAPCQATTNRSGRLRTLKIDERCPALEVLNEYAADATGTSNGGH